MSEWGFEGNYGDVVTKNGQTVRGYMLSPGKHGKFEVITDQGEIVTVEAVYNKSKCMYEQSACKVSKAVEAKVDLFGYRYATWDKKWLEDPKKVERMKRDWLRAIEEDSLIKEVKALEIINSKIDGRYGYTARIESMKEGNQCIVGIECKVPMDKGVYGYVAKCLLIGMQDYEIQESEIFKKSAMEILKKRGRLVEKRGDGNMSRVSVDVKSDSVVHIVYRNYAIVRTKRGVETLAEELMRELEWKGPKMA